jgi:molybdate transport repressor ModE-like protein
MALKDHLEKLHAFAAVARIGSISAAAKELAISQTALSHSVKVLEDAVGTPLLNRGRSGVSLTASGQLLYDYSKRLLLDVASLQKSLLDPSVQAIGKLRVGTHETLAIHVWPHFLESFAAKYPKIQISLISGRIDALVDGVLNHDFHVIVTVEPEADPRLHREPLYHDRLAFYGSARTAKASMTLAEARKLPVLTDAQAHQQQSVPLPRLLSKNGFRESEQFELNSFEAAIRLAEKGLGLALLPRRNAQGSVDAGLLRKVEIKGLASDFGNYTLCATSLAKNQADYLPALLRRELTQFLQG